MNDETASARKLLQFAMTAPAQLELPGDLLDAAATSSPAHAMAEGAQSFAYPALVQKGSLPDISCRRSVEGASDALGVLDMPALVEELEAQNKRLMEAQARTHQWVASLVHELRNQIQPIELGLHLLQEANAEDLEGTIALMEDSLRRMKRLTSEVVAAAAPGASPSLHPVANVPVEDLLEETLHQFSLLARESQIQLTVEILDRPEVEGDYDQLLQVLQNLAGNAIKFTPAGGAVTLRCAKTRHEAWISIADTGAGLTDAQKAGLFAPFSQGHPEFAAMGAGLGLSICRGIVRAHGGRLWAESAGAGRGSTFWITLPIRERDSLA